MEAVEIIHCRGHSLVLGTHPTTFEVTKEEHLTENGNCIVGVGADKGCADLSEEFRGMLSHDDAVLVTRLVCGECEAVIRSRGSSGLSLNHPTDLVWRKSTFTCGRTIGICSDHVAATLLRELVTALKSGAEMTVTLTVTRPGTGS
ncbi:MAG: DUF371 domain-containing protein [Methanoregula sp.]|jgi:hypothetical protein